MRLLYADSEQISSLIDQMEKECNRIRADSMKMSWYMRGGASYNDVMNMSINERDIINKLIEDNLETTKNTKMPFF
jgi:hypothetical protein